MRQYKKYLLAHLFWPAVLITLALTGIVWLTQVLRFIDFMLNRGLTLGDFLYLTGLMLPGLLLLIMPIAMCIAVMFTYNRLTADSELIVLNAVGISRLQLAQPVMMAGIACSIICYALALYLMPIANQHFRDIRTFFRDKYSSILLEEEVFNAPIDGVTVFIRSRDSDQTLHGVLIHDSRNPKETITMIADRGHMQQTPTGPRFYLEHGIRQSLREGRVGWLTFDNYALDIAFFAKDQARDREPDELNINQLFNPPPNLTPKQVAMLRAEGHYRLTWPALSFSLPLMAVSFLFSGEFNRRGQWRRMMMASGAMLVTAVVFFTLRNAIIKQPMLIPAIYLAAMGPAIWAVYVLGTARATRRRVPALPQPQES